MKSPGWLRRHGRQSPVASDGAPAPAVAPARPDPVRTDDIDLGGVLRILARRWLFILLVMAVSVGLSGAYIAVTPKTWRATARVLLDPRDKQVVGPSVAQPVQGVDLVWIETQADLVTSAASLSAVASGQNLMADPELGGSPDETLRKLAEAILVERSDQTYVLNIHVTTLSAEKSARLAQAVAEAFVDSLVDAKADNARQASTLIGRQVDDLRERARQADDRLQAFKREKGILAANGRLIDEDRLRQLNDSYIAAQARTAELKARRDRLASAARAGSTGFDSALDSITSAVVSRLKIEYALAAKQVAELAQDLGPSHPRMVSARADMERTRALLAEEVASQAERAKADYDVALANEASVKASLDAATEAVNLSGAAGVELRELENEAIVRRDIYRGFVSRMEETGLQESTQISDARVIVPAQVPIRPFSPRRSLILALALIGGFGVGLSGALYRGRGDLIAATLRRDEPPMTDGPTGADATPDRVVEPVRSPAVVETGAPVEAAAVPIVPAPPPQRVAAVESPAVVPDAVREAPQGVRVLADVTVDTALVAPGRLGRPIARAPREIVASVVEDGPGRPHRRGEAMMGKLLRRLPRAGATGGMTLVFGTADAPSIAAVSFGLAHAAAAGGATSVLLVDAAVDRFRMADAFFDAPAPGLLDVIRGTAEPGAVAAGIDDLDLTLVAAATAGSGDALERQAMRVADFAAALAADFGHTVVHLGETLSPALLDAFGAHADAVILVADRALEADPDAAALFDAVAAATPMFAGLVLVSERRAETVRAEARAVA